MINIFHASQAFKQIENNLKENSLSHAYLFLSPDELNNALFVKEITKLILCGNKSSCGECPSCLKVLADSHPDVLKYPKDKNFVVDDANSITAHACEIPMISDKKIIIINNIDEATNQAQNKILKTLEEPPKAVIFLLTAKNESKILPTIISRTRKSTLLPLYREDLKNYILNTRNVDKNILLDSLDYGEGWIGKTLNALENENFAEEERLVKEIVTAFNSSKNISITSSKILHYKDDIKIILELLAKEFSKSLTSNNYDLCEGASKIIEEINLANQNIDRYVNINLIVDNLLMKILEIKYLYQMQI